MLELNPLDHPICLAMPNRLTSGSAWHEHIPFAMFLVDLLRPKMIVELGTAHGDSYCAFCQAVKELHLNTACYAVDTWKGDPQSYFYGPEVLADLRDHHDPLYSSFSGLIQSTFDEALEHFADGTVDLLHIDGYHTYESVRHDFEAWLPKMSSHGVVLFHDTNVREQDFGIRKFWDEVKLKYPHFEFLHGHGLGVLAVGKVRSKELQKLFKLPEEESIRIREFFFQLGHQLTTRVRNSELENQKRQLADKDAQIAGLETSLQEKVTQIHGLESQIHGLESQIHGLESQIYQIQRSIPMQLVNRYQRAIEKLLRPGTRRRYYYELGLAGIRVILNEGGRCLWSRFRGWLGRRITEHTQTKFPMLYLLKPAKQPMSTTSSGQQDAHTQGLPRVDVVTATYNSSRFVKDLVQSLQESDYPANLITVTVVDNGSSDDTLKILQSTSKARCFTRFEVIDAARNLGYGKAVNLAAKTGNAPYILVVNPDVKFVPDCLSILVRRAVCDAEACLWEPRQFPYEHPKYYDPLTLETIWSSGAAFLVRRDKFEELGGFDESFFLYGEDVDLSFRMWNSGGKCRYVPSAVLWHYAYSRPGEVKPLQWYYSLRNNLLIRYKFGRMSDVIKGYMLLFGVLVRGAAIPRASLRVLSAFFSHLKLIPPTLMWRLRTSRAVFKNYRFAGWDFEMSKLGAFYENRPSAEKPLVTVLIRTKERPSYLRDALRSVANQTYRPIEVVVVEDGPATSEAVIDEFVGAPGLAVKYHPLGVSRGRCSAGNEALRLASGRFLNFLDDDDLLFPDHIEVLVQALLSHNLQYKAAYSASFMVKASYTTEAILPHEFNSFFNQYCKDELKTRNLFPVQAVMFYRDLYDSLGGLDKGAEGLEDWDIWLRYAKATDFLAVEKTTSEFRVPKDPTLISERQSELNRLYWFVRKRHELL